MKTVLSIVLAVALRSSILWSQSAFRPTIPKPWDQVALADWATPVAGINVRPTHLSAKDYYSMPIDNLRTYPVYYPGREPDGYWEMLRHIGPKPLIEPDKLNSEGEMDRSGPASFR